MGLFHLLYTFLVLDLSSPFSKIYSKFTQKWPFLALVLALNIDESQTGAKTDASLDLRALGVYDLGPPSFQKTCINFKILEISTLCSAVLCILLIYTLFIFTLLY